MDDRQNDPWAAPESPGASGPGGPSASAYPAGPVPPAAAPPQPPATVQQEERTWALLAHLSALAGLVIPLGNILGPLVVWLAKKDQSRFVDHQGKEALNFQITMTIALFITGVAAFVGILLTIVLVGIPILIAAFVAMAVFGILAIVFAIVGGIKANDGFWYRYPMTWRFIQ